MKLLSNEKVIHNETSRCDQYDVNGANGGQYRISGAVDLKELLTRIQRQCIRCRKVAKQSRLIKGCRSGIVVEMVVVQVFFTSVIP